MKIVVILLVGLFILISPTKQVRMCDYLGGVDNEE